VLIGDSSNWATIFKNLSAPVASETAGTVTAGAEAQLMGGRAAASVLPELAGTGVGWALPATGALLAGISIGTAIDQTFLHSRAYFGGYRDNNSVNSCTSGTGFSAGAWNINADTPSLYGLSGVASDYYRFSATMNCNGQTVGGNIAYGHGTYTSATVGTFDGLSCSGSGSPGSPQLSKPYWEGLLAFATGTPNAMIRYLNAGSGCIQAAVFMVRATFGAGLRAGVDYYGPKRATDTANETLTGFVPAADPGSGSAAATAIRAALLSGSDAADLEVAKALLPGVAVEPTLGTITLPAPDANETVHAYRDRLRALGWLGALTVASPVSDASSPLWGPLAPRLVRVRPGTGTEEALTMPGWAPVGYAGPAATDWPDNPPTVGLNDPVEITPNISTADPVDTDTATPPVGLDAGGSLGSCVHSDYGSIDVSPITAFDYGSKFPFGVFGWVSDQWDAINVSAVAPAWSIPVYGADGWTADYDIDLAPFSPYMAIMRTVLAWVMWVGSLWFIATSFLGIRGSGNPADAIDDYLDQIV
jgi:hypothetical protein